MKTTRMIDLLSTLGALTMAATPLVAISATAHAAVLTTPAAHVSVVSHTIGGPVAGSRIAR